MIDGPPLFYPNPAHGRDSFYPFGDLFLFPQKALGPVDQNYLQKNPDECSVHEGYETQITVGDVVGHKQFCFAGLPAKLKEAEEKEGFTAALGRINFSTNPFPGTVTINCTRVRMIDGTSTADLTNAEIEGRNQAFELYRFLRKYVPGFENAFLASTNYQIGVRESRHIRGIYTLTEEDAVFVVNYHVSIYVGVSRSN